MYTIKPEMSKLTTTSPTPTRNHGKNMLIYIMRVLDLADDSPLVQALNVEGREDITSFLEISKQNIDDLEYLKDDTLTIVPEFQRSRVKVFFGYISYRKHQKKTIGVDWVSVTVDKLN